MQTLTRFSWVLAVFGVLFAVAAASHWYIFGEATPVWTGLVVTAGALFSGWLYADRDHLAASVQSKEFSRSAGSVSLVVIAACLAVALNMLGTKKDKRWDLTMDRRHTLSEKTLGVASGLTEDVQVLVFFLPGHPEAAKFRDLVDNLATQSPRLKVEHINPLREPERAEAYQIDPDRGAVVLQLGDKRQKLERKYDQETLTNALVRLTAGDDHPICWSSGHGEPAPDDEQSRDGLGAAVLALEDTNYTVSTRQILLDGLKGCEALVIARPESPYTAPEREAVAAYVASGGRLLVLTDPGEQTALDADLARYGALVGNDVVIEDSEEARMMDMPPTYLLLGEMIGSFGMHPITDKLHALVVIGTGRSVSPVPADGRTVTSLLQTTPMAWAETDLDPTTPKSPDEGQRPITLGVAVEISDPATIGVRAPGAPAAPPPAPAPADTDTDDTDTDAPLVAVPVDLTAPTALTDGDPSKGVPADFAPQAGGRVVVLGDSDFANNQMVGLYNNRDLFLNSVAWLVEEDDQLGEQAGDGEKQRITMNLIEGAAFFLGTVLLVPGGLAGVGFLMMMRRRML